MLQVIQILIAKLFLLLELLTLKNYQLYGINKQILLFQTKTNN